MKRIATFAAAAIAAAVWTVPTSAQNAGVSGTSQTGNSATNTRTGNINDANLDNRAGGSVDLNTSNSNAKIETGKDTGTWNVRHELSEVAEDALTKGDLKTLTNRFVKADADRIEKSADFKKDDPQLDAKIDQINNEWKSKFGHEFKVSDTKDVFADATVKFGEMGRDAQLSSDIQKNSEAANPADKNKSFGGKEKIEKGRDVASVSLPAMGDAPALTVPMIHELPAMWKINVPDSMDATKLRENLSKHLDMVADSSKWPSDEKQAMAMVTRHVLMAVLDTDNATRGATGNTTDLNAVPASSSNSSNTAPGSTTPNTSTNSNSSNAPANR
jgi:hypothetical protein